MLILTGLAPLPDDLTAAEDLAASATPLDRPKGGRYELLGNWPWNSDELDKGRTIHHMPPSRWLHLIQGEKSPTRVSLFVSNERLTMGTFTLRPGTVSDPEEHPGDEIAFVTEGAAHVYLPESRQVFDMETLDATYIPEGTPHRYINESSEPATDAALDIIRIERYLRVLGEKVVCVDGGGEFSFAFTHTAGARAMVSTVSNFWPELPLRLYAAVTKGGPGAALEMMRDVAGFLDFWYDNQSTRMHKRAMEMRGLAAGPVRPPLVDPISPEQERRLKALLDEQGPT